MSEQQVSGPQAAPGWYPDPDGAPGTARWWNGAAWSDVTTAAGPGVRLEAPLPPPRPAADTGQPVPAAPALGARRGVVVALLAVLALVLVVVLGVVVGRSGTGDATTATSDPRVPAPPGTTFAPGTVQIVDQQAGIAYPYLGNGWYEYDLGNQAETTATAGQYFTTQEVTPGGGQFIAECTSGPLAATFGYSGPASLAATATRVQAHERASYYPAPNEQKTTRDEDLTVDGHPAHVVQFDLSWAVAGYDASGERAALLLVDVGRPAPALLYVSIPNTHAELYGAIDQVLAGVTVLD